MSSKKAKSSSKTTDLSSAKTKKPIKKISPPIKIETPKIALAKKAIKKEAIKKEAIKKEAIKKENILDEDPDNTSESDKKNEIKSQIIAVDDDGEEFSDEEDDLELEELPEHNMARESDKYEFKPAVRKELVFVKPEDRVTSNTMSAYEKARIIAIRASQIEQNNKHFIDVTGMSDPSEMALEELIRGKCPLSVVRKLNDGKAELWHANELIIPLN